MNNFSAMGKNQQRRRAYMEININRPDRIAEVWLTNAEQQNPRTQLALRPFFEEYKAKKYTVAVFCSGSEDLKAKTAHLLLNNRK